MSRKHLAAFLLAVASALAVPSVAQAQFIATPPAGTFQMRADLAGKHPRLHFVATDIPDIRARATSSRKFYLDRAKSAFGGYKGGAAVFDGSWKDYLYGFWGQFAMDMFFLAEQDQAWADTAKSWALTAARAQSSWLADDLVPMDITSGMALTYDILYDQLTAAEQAELRAALFKAADFIYARFFVDQYWTGDGQNNHLHNRIHGMAHAAFAILGDDPAYNAQKHADLAASAYAQVVASLPDDGSNHEGPGYWDYSYHWVVRTARLIAHVTGKDPTAQSPHFENDLYFRAYMTAPGWKNTFGIGDSSDGEPSNVEAIAPAAQQDAYGASILRELMATDPNGFYQQSAWGLLWYDGDMTAKPYAGLPLWRFWPDLEMLSIRSSWDADATAAVFKCGPPGGNKMQQQRQPNWFNVAHDHPDQNHFLLFAHGKMLAQDDGYPQEKKLTRSHNTLLVDGAGQTREGEAWYQPFPYAGTGHLVDVFASGATALATGDASKLYVGASKVMRHWAFVEGGYVAMVDDLAAADTADHDFEWRLHKTGIWILGAAGTAAIADGDVSLAVQFLAPLGTALQTQVLAAELTAPPCLSAKTRANKARFVSAVVPQKAGAPAIAFEALTATGGAALKATNGAVTDVLGVADAAGPLSFGDVTADGAAALVRRTGTALDLALLVRGGTLQVGGRKILSADKPANLAVRPTPTGAAVEVEAAYKATGADTKIEVGALAGNHRYDVSVDGQAAPTADADAQGVVALSISLAARRALLLTDRGLVTGGEDVPDAGPGVIGGIGGSAGIGGGAGAGGGAGGAGGSGGIAGGSGGATADASAGGATSAPATAESSGGCGCRTSSSGGGGATALFLLAALLWRRMRPGRTPGTAHPAAAS